MAWIDDFTGDLIALDTAPLIYFLEANPRYSPVVDPFFEAVAQGSLRLVTSTITLIEVLVHPLRMGKLALAQQYRTLLLDAPGVSVHPLTAAIAEVAARLRAEYDIATPDAIQLATAISTGAEVLFTNDARLPKVTGVEIVLADELLLSPSRDSLPKRQSKGIENPDHTPGEGTLCGEYLMQPFSCHRSLRTSLPSIFMPRIIPFSSRSSPVRIGAGASLTRSCWRRTGRLTDPGIIALRPTPTSGTKRAMARSPRIA